MSILDKLIGLGLAEDLTETSWWTDAVYRGLTQEDFNLLGAGSAVAAQAQAVAQEQTPGSI
jgi:hypothetical protein